MKLSYTGVSAPAGLRQHAAFKPCRPDLRSRRRVIIRSEANKSGTFKLGGTFKAAGGFGDLLGTITRTIGTVSKAAPSKGPKDQKTVFLAGATGRLGARVLRELLAAGFKVRAGARDIDNAKANTEIAVQFGLIAPEQLRNLTWVEFDLEDASSMAAAIGNANKVVCAVGAPESATLDSSAPRRIDGDGSINLIEAASSAGVEQFVLVTSLGTGKFGFPAAALNLFWGVLTQKRRAEEALERSGMSYCIVRPGGMERPKDDYKLTHKLTVKPRDSVFGGQVSRLQVAELITAAVLNPELATNKCLELVAETTAPERSLEDLLDSLPTEITKEEQEQLAAIEAEARKELKAAQAKLEEANEVFAVSSDKVAQLTDALREAKANEKEVRSEVTGVLREGAQAKRALEAAEAAAEKAAREEAVARAVLEAAKKAGAAGELLSARDLQEVARQALQPPKPKEEARAPSPFGLFGAKPAPAAAAAAAAQEKKQEAPARSASPFGALFGAPKPPVQVEEEEEEEEEVEEVVIARPTSPLAALFGGAGQRQQQVEEEEEEEEEEEVVPEQPAPARASPFAALFGAPKPQPPTPAPAAAAAAKAPVKPEPVKPAEPKAPAPARPASPWAGLFGGGGATIQVGEETKIQVPDRPDAEAPRKAAPAPAPAAPVAPAAAAARAAPPAVDAAAAAAAEAKRKAAVEEAKAKLQKEQEAAAAAAAKKAEEAQRIAREEQEARERAAAAAAAAAAAEAEALARLKQEREEAARKAAEAKAKKEAEARAKAKAEAEAAARAVAERLAAEKAKAEAAQRAAAERLRAETRSPEASVEEEERKPEPAKPAAAAAAPVKAAAAAPKAAAPAASEQVAGNVAEARAWIEAWRSKQGGKPSSSSSSKAAAPAAKPAPKSAPASSSSSSSNGDVPANVQEARQWIANWRAKSQGGDSSGAEGAAAAQPQEEDGVQVVEQENIFASVGKLFGGFGGQK